VTSAPAAAGGRAVASYRDRHAPRPAPGRGAAGPGRRLRQQWGRRREPAAGEPRTLQLQAAGGEGELNALRELVAAFEQANDGVTVDFVGVPSQGDHIAKLATAFAGGNPPDVFLLNYRRLGPFVARGVLAPVQLGDLDRADFYEPPLEAFTYDGELACLPQNISSSVAYLNLDLFERAGVPLPAAEWTWDGPQRGGEGLRRRRHRGLRARAAGAQRRAVRVERRR
jgi:multiple sugar transport system substrate-binding protein